MTIKMIMEMSIHRMSSEKMTMGMTNMEKMRIIMTSKIILVM